MKNKAKVLQKFLKNSKVIETAKHIISQNWSKAKAKLEEINKMHYMNQRQEDVSVSENKTEK